MSISNLPPLHRRFGRLALVVLMTAGPVGCGWGGGGGGGSDEVISTGPGQAVIPKQELVNLGATEKSLAPPPRVKKAR